MDGLPKLKIAHAVLKLTSSIIGVDNNLEYVRMHIGA